MRGGLRILFVCAIVYAGAVTEAGAAWGWGKKGSETEKQQPSEQKSAGQKGTNKTPAPAAPVVPDEAARKAKRELVEKKRQEMNGFSWEIEMTPMAGKGKKFSESVIFSDGKVSFKNFSLKGFEPTNFSLKLQDDKTLVWETMQTSEKSGVLFWRGEISPDNKIMRGVASHQVNEKTKEGYTFVSLSKQDQAEQQKIEAPAKARKP